MVVTAPPKILCVHPHSELYGSDRVFIRSVQAFRERWPDAHVTVLLRSEGPGAQALRETGADVQIAPINVLRRAKLGRTIANMARLPLDMIAAWRRMRGQDLVYISTVVVLDYILATRFSRTPAMIHLHELPAGREGQVFAGLLRWSKARFICISAAVRDAFPGMSGREMPVVWNGVADRPVAPPDRGDGKLHLLLIGRFNAWKGQPLLIDAVAALSPDERARLAVRIVGSVYQGQDHFATDIQERIARHGLADCITVSGFVPVPDAHYDWAHVVAVPSTKPEPFGLVAIESMAAGRAVIAAGHGGLAEIVVGDETGTLVMPGDVASLVAAIRRYLADPALAGQQGAAGRARFEAMFREDIYRRAIADQAAELMGRD